jgi:hypothetical protein
VTQKRHFPLLINIAFVGGWRLGRLGYLGIAALVQHMVKVAAVRVARATASHRRLALVLQPGVAARGAHLVTFNREIPVRFQQGSVGCPSGASAPPLTVPVRSP